MDLSLDDIIRKQRRTKPNVRKNGIQSAQYKNNNSAILKGFGAEHSKDARYHIILKKRTQITDARDKLAEIAKQKDARDKLERLRMNRLKKGGSINRSVLGNIVLSKNKSGAMNFKTKGRINRGIFSDVTRQVHTSPLALSPHYSRNIHLSSVIPMSGYPDDISMEEEYVPVPLKPIVRSINNDIPHYLPPPPDFPQLSRIKNHQPLRDKMIMNDRRASLNLKIIAKNNDLPSLNHGPLKRNQRPDETPYSRGNSPTSPVSILKKRPFGGKVISGNLNRFEGQSSLSPIRSSARQQQQSRPVSPQTNGFRIVVSNLQNSVTAADIHELFGDIGKLVESRLVRTGTAEVIYSSLKDAQKAVDVYHNRQLDGQPMKCFLVNPRNPPSNKDSATSKFTSRPGKPVLPASSNSSVVPDISTFHKVLFRKR